jgi:phage baseplate assembly protein W
MLTVQQEIIGAGWSFPLRIDVAGGVVLSDGERKLEESIRLILSTAIGERPMRPEFGCAIHDFVFATSEDATMAEIAMAVREALARWEPRIQVIDVEVAPDGDEPELLWIDVRYAPCDTNNPRNLVVPFYTIPAQEDET